MSRAHLVHYLGKSLLQFAVHGSQLLVITVGFQNRDKIFVHFIHRLIQSALKKGGRGVRRAPSRSQIPPAAFVLAINPLPKKLASYIYLLREAHLTN